MEAGSAVPWKRRMRTLWNRSGRCFPSTSARNSVGENWTESTLAIISLFRSITLLDDDQQSARRESEATLSATRDEIATERERNRKPEIRIEIMEGFFNAGAF